MNWIDKLERKFGFIAIPRLMLLVVVGQVLVTLLGMQESSAPAFLALDPVAVARGEWWRLVTWVLVPAPMQIIYAFFWFMFLWSVGNVLDAQWGAFKATLYILLGTALPALGCMLHWQYGGGVSQLTASGSIFTITMLLAYATLAPDNELYIFFVLPVKMRWIAWGLGIWLTLKMLSGGPLVALSVALGVANYVVFFLAQGLQALRLKRAVSQGREVLVQAKREVAQLEQLRPKACAQCGAGADADLRLCHCESCGEHGKFWCFEHLKPHLEPPKISGKSSKPKTKRKG